jgi:hypothetical protein
MHSDEIRFPYSFVPAFVPSIHGNPQARVLGFVMAGRSPSTNDKVIHLSGSER